MDDLRIRVDETATRLFISGSQPAIKLVWEHFKYRPPNFFMSAAYQLYRKAIKENDPSKWPIVRGVPRPPGWDGFMCPMKQIRDKPGEWWLDRGHKEQLLEFCADDGIQVEGKMLKSPFADMEVDDVPDDLLPGAPFKLDFSQCECCCNLLRHAIGTVKMSVNAGKTAVAFGSFALVKRTFSAARLLYITPSERLVRQATKEGKKFLPDWSITQYGGGKHDKTGEDVVVCTSSILYRNFTELQAEGFFKRFMVIFYDEVHHSQSASSEEVLRAIPAFFRFGASDTVKDEKKEDAEKGLKIRGLFGPPRAEVEIFPLIQVGRAATPTINLVDIPEWEGKFDHLPHQVLPNTPAWASIDDVWHKGIYLGPVWKKDDDGNLVLDRKKRPVPELGWHQIEVGKATHEVTTRQALLERAYDQGVIKFKPRNELIVEWATYFSKKEWPTLVVATRTIHVHILETLLGRAGLDVRSLISDHTSKERDEVFDWLIHSKGGVLISPLVKEGVSMPELRAGIVADVVADADLARQIIGRFIRKKVGGDNTAELVWFLDRQYKSARAGGMRVFKALEQIRGYTFRYPCQGPSCLGPLYKAANMD